MKYIVKQLILSNKYIFSNPKNIILLLGIPIFSLAIPIVFIPLRFSFSVFVIIGTIIPSAIIYISIAYSWRDGTLYKNLNSTNNSKYNFYIAMLIEMALVSITLLLFSIVILSILDSFDLVLAEWIWSNSNNSDYNYVFRKINFIALVYSELEAVVVTFSILFFAQNLISNKKNMYILLMVIIVLSVVYGGAFNNYFTRKIKLNENVSVSYYGAMMFPDSIYWLSLLFPLFGPSQHLASIGSSFLYNGAAGNFSYIGDTSFRFFIWENSTKLGVTHLDALRWNILWIIPYVWVGLFAIGGLFVNKVN